MSDKIQKILGEEGNIPLAAKPDSIENPKSRELITAFNAYQDGNGLAFYPDWPAPGYYDTWMGATQNLMNGGKLGASGGGPTAAHRLTKWVCSPREPG